MKFTKFTINNDIAAKSKTILDEMVAIPLIIHPVKFNGIDTGVLDYSWDKVSRITEDLPEGATFVVAQEISRSKLKKIFGSAAMVRGVSIF